MAKNIVSVSIDQDVIDQIKTEGINLSSTVNELLIDFLSGATAKERLLERKKLYQFKLEGIEKRLAGLDGMAAATSYRKERKETEEKLKLEKLRQLLEANLERGTTIGGQPFSDDGIKRMERELARILEKLGTEAGK